MSTDRELLELAAKAYGLEYYDYVGYGMQEQRVHAVPHCGYAGAVWNSLTNDGDTMRLAMHLGIGVYETQKGVEARKGPDIVCEQLGKTPAHYRRAITRAAAEIGRAMP